MILHEGMGPEYLSSDCVNALQAVFPKLPNFENFLNVANRSGLPISLLVKYLLHLNNRGNEEQFLDFTDVPVCKNHGVYKRRVANEIARGIHGLFRHCPYCICSSLLGNL